MSYSYEFLPAVALADTAFLVRANSWGNLFTGSTAALTAVMINPDDLLNTQKKAIEITAHSVEELLFDWLAELVYLKDAEAFLCKSSNVEVSSGAIWHAKGGLTGDTIAPVRQRLGQDVKAVTYHLFRVWQEGDEHMAQVVLDI
jgi:SHS2 domain-containing protein